MGRLYKKCKSQKGASLLIALLFFLLCLTVGTVVLTAAGASAGRLAQMRQEEQSYLTASSAARMLRDKLEGARAETVTVWVDGSLSTAQGSPWSSDAAILAKTIEADAEKIYDYTLPSVSGAASSRSLTIEAEGLETAVLTWQMGKDYSIQATLRVGEDDSSPLTLTIPAVEEVSTANTYRTESEQVGVDEETGQPIYNTYTITTTKETRTVTWGIGIIQKGAGA
ncbi:MAG: hypothetical protein VB096_04520 [Pseudoflavonifractor sp.]|nr:hypothetical protein [Pseudoflavonifractor sp.]